VEKESKWLWLAYLPFVLLLYWLGATHLHNKSTVLFFIIFLAASFALAPFFKFFWSLDRKRRQK